MVKDVSLPGKATRFDYQAVDAEKGHLIMAHMGDNAVAIVNLSDGTVVKVIDGISTARGVATAPDAKRIFVTSKPNQLVIIDSETLEIVSRVETGSSPDGVAWDSVHRIVGVSDQGDGAVSLIADAGNGGRTQVDVGAETGNVIFDDSREQFWVTVVAAEDANLLVAIDPVKATVVKSVDLPDCEGAHGLRLDPERKTGLVACEGNAKLMRVPLDGGGGIVSAPTSDGPDVIDVDPGFGWLYVAAEGGDMSIFDIGKPGLTELHKQNVGDNAHTVAVDPVTHRVFFPLQDGPVLRIMKPQGL
ncbi:MAG: YncE family protein [Polyangiaceae bacterium]|nr:YncE family protein [Polyangiaceae bacterium]